MCSLCVARVAGQAVFVSPRLFSALLISALPPAVVCVHSCSLGSRSSVVFAASCMCVTGQHTALSTRTPAEGESQAPQQLNK
mmetsp:Transcript_10537/g.31044  ORF Transcript_10537/g.31044 Transcript_10537/m.31044 type:complete len:82 (+) Transcript_10537:1147-1392(+)